MVSIPTIFSPVISTSLPVKPSAGPDRTGEYRWAKQADHRGWQTAVDDHLGEQGRCVSIEAPLDDLNRILPSSGKPMKYQNKPLQGIRKDG